MTTESSNMAQEQQEALLQAQPAEADREDAPAGAGFPWMTLLGFAFLTFNSVLAIRRSDGDRAAIAFIVFSYLDLVLLFVCLRWYERAAPDSATRGRLKVAVWLLTTLLTMVFSYKVAAIMPVAVKVLVWAMACATVLGGFYAFFVHAEPKSENSEQRSCGGAGRSSTAMGRSAGNDLVLCFLPGARSGKEDNR